MVKSLERDGDFWRQKFNSAEERAQREVTPLACYRVGECRVAGSVPSRRTPCHATRARPLESIPGRERELKSGWIRGTERCSATQVMAHAETIKQLQAADKAKTMLDNAIQEHIRARDTAKANLVSRMAPRRAECHVILPAHGWRALAAPIAPAAECAGSRAQAAAERGMAAKASELTAVVDAANRKRDELEQQNKLLHEQLDKMARQLPGEGEHSVCRQMSSCSRVQSTAVFWKRWRSVHKGRKPISTDDAVPSP